MNFFKIFTVFKNKVGGIQIAVVLILIMIAFSACKKGNLPNGEGTRLVKIIAKEDDSLGVAVFHYDEDDRLIRIVETVNNKSSYQTHLHYHISGKLLQTDHEFIPNSSSWTVKYSYSNDLLIMKVASDAFGERSKNKYAYNPQGKLIADTSYRPDLQDTSYRSFRYNTSENIEEVEYFFDYSGTWQNSGGEQAMYNDNAMNPFNSMGLMYYINGHGNYFDYTLLSKNLVTKSTTALGPINYQYEYYSNGLPRHILITSVYPDRTKVTTADLFYE